MNIIEDWSNRCECHGSSEMNIIEGWPVSQRCGTLKNPHCSNEHENSFFFSHIDFPCIKIYPFRQLQNLNQTGL